MVYEIKDPETVSALFGSPKEAILRSCLEHIIGTIYADDNKHPSAAMAVLGDFAFYAGTPNQKLAAFRPQSSGGDFMIRIWQHKSWKNTILAHYKERARIVSRFATKKEPGIFDKDYLKQIAASLPQGYEICMIDEPIYELCKTEPWSTDLVSQFPHYSDYRRLGLGAVIRNGRRIISGASSYARYQDGIEIEIDTCKEFRRKGFARICGAKLILECLQRNLYPSWDAQNPASLALAKQLGYHFSHTYEAIETWGT